MMNLFIKKKIKTHLVCFDDYRTFSDDVKKRFADTSQYTVITYHTREEFINYFEKGKDYKGCKVALLGVHDTVDHYNFINDIILNLRALDEHVGVILICPVEKTEEIKKVIRHNVDAFIPKNTNSILRIHNIVKKLISENSIKIFRKRRNLSLCILLLFILISFLVVFISYLKLPLYF
jgi:hypothetical protein